MDASNESTLNGKIREHVGQVAVPVLDRMRRSPFLLMAILHTRTNRIDPSTFNMLCVCEPIDEDDEASAQPCRCYAEMILLK